MKDFYKAYLKNSDVDMKKLQKPRMESGRMERRERDKLARQQIQNPRPEASLFPEPVRAEGDSSIDSKLGDYDAARSLFQEPKQTRIIGITTSVTKPPPPVQRMPPPQQQPYPVGALGSTSTSSGFAPPPSQNNRNIPPPSSHRYHPPHPSLSSSQQSRTGSGTYLKQPDPKVTHNGRYPAPPNKHDTHQKSSGGSGSLGPPPPQTSSAMMTNGRLNDKGLGSSATSNIGSNPNGRFQVPQAPPKQHSRYIEPSPPPSGDIENILKEMTRRTMPVTEIAATPRKEFENKFSFGQQNNHVYASLPPALTDTLTRQRDKTFNVPTSKLENDLELSESDDDHKKQTSTGRASPTNDNSSDSSDSGSSDSESEESTGGARAAEATNRKLINCNRVEDPAITSRNASETSAWNLSKYFRKEKAIEGLDASCHDNIKHEPNRIDDSLLSSPATSPTTYRHESNQINPILPIDIKTESLTQEYNKANSNNNCLQLQPDQIKSENFEKSPSSSPEKVQHSDTVESDQIESVLAVAKGLAEFKPVSDLGTSSDDDESAKQKPIPVPVPANKSPAKKPVKRRRKVQKDKKSANTDSSDEDADFSSANNLSDRSRSVEKEKKGRGRPRKNPVVAPTVTTNKSPAVVTPVKNAPANSKREAPARKGGAGRRTSRQNSMVKSREILETTTDSSSEDDRPAPSKPAILPSPTLSATAQVIPAKLAEIGSRGASAPVGGGHLPVHKAPVKAENNVPAATSKSSDDDDDDDDDSSSSSDNSDDERVPSVADRASPRPQYLSEHHSSSPSHHSTSSSSEDHSDSDSESPPREDKKIRDKTKSDKLKSDTLRKLFIGSNRGEGGAKGKGQVLIVDQSEESQNHPAKDAPPIHHEKILSPIAFKQHNNNNNNNNSSNNDIMQHVPPPTTITTTSNHLKSPRTSAAAMIGGTTPTAANVVSSVSNSTSNSKSPALRTPERMPTMNSNSKVHSVNNNSSNVSNSNVHNVSSPIICRIDLSRVQIPKAWLQNSYRMRDNNSNSSNSSTQIQSAPQSDDDRLKSPKLPLTPKSGNNSSSKLNHKILDSSPVNNNPSMNLRLVNSDSIANQTATTASSPVSSRLVDGSGLNNNHCNRLLKDADRLSPALQPPTSQLHPSLVSPKHEQLLLHPGNMKSNSGGSIKHESIKSEFTSDEYIAKSQNLLENKCNLYNNPKLVRNNNVKQEQYIKNEYKNSFIGNDCDRSNQTQAPPIDPIGGGAHGTVPPPMTAINANCPIGMKTTSSSDEPIPKNRRKRSSSSSSSPYKEKKRKKTAGAPLQNEVLEQLPPTNHDRLADKYSPPSPIVQTVYKSYFEREGDDARLGQDQEAYLQEAKHLKHLADRESGHFNQVALYLKAVLYFLLSAAGMEQEDRIPSAFTIYKDTLSLIKFISSKFIMHPPMQGIDNTNKVAILSLRCQSLISLKLHSLRRNESKEAQKTISHFMTKGVTEIISGSTPSISPSSVSSLGSGSNTPPLHVVQARYPPVHHFPKYSAETTYPFEVHAAFQRQTFAYNYISSAHELWEQADSLVKKGNHMDFFIDLDRVNGPLTLHSSMFELFKYVQAGLHKLNKM